MEDDTDTTDIMYDDNRLKLEYSKKYMDKLRVMWDEMFGDSQTFTDYYFDNVCKDNDILVALYDDEPVGMVHLNSYRLQVFDKCYECRYIVGVAVNKKYREKGIMKKMLSRIKMDYTGKDKFIFLMPEKEEYYSGLGFVKVYNNWVMEFNILNENTVEELCDRELQAGAFSICPLTEYDDSSLLHLAAEINELLETKYKMFSYRDKNYLMRMLNEHMSENGNVCVVRSESEELVGVFAYGIMDGMLYAERVEIFNGRIEDIIACILKTSIDNSCVGCIVTVAHDDVKDSLPDMQGLDVQIDEGHGIMAYFPEEFERNTGIRINDIINKTFLDEIV